MESRSLFAFPDRTTVRKVPVWGRPRGITERDVDAGYFAGVALNSLDALVQSDPLWAGVWRQRLALKSAAAASRLIGHKEEEGDLRDALYFRTPGDEPGPAGALLVAARRLASTSTALDEGMVRSLADHLEIRWDGALADVVTNAEEMTGSARPAPVLAAELAAETFRVRPDAELLAYCLADLLLAQRLRWSVPVPLLMGQLNAASFKAADPRRRLRPGQDGWTRAVLLAYATSAAEACDLGAHLATRAARLSEVAPRLRSKAADQVVRLLLDDDAVPSSRPDARLSDRSARRLFERLGKLGAVRELSGRPTFRLYGL